MLSGFVLVAAASAANADDTDDLSKKLQNPVADLISVPIQGNFDWQGGDGRGRAATINVQPVVPVKLNEDWNLIVRTIMPLSYRHHYGPDRVFGLGDITQSFFFSPRHPSGLTWGAGPVFLWPTATDEILGGGKWGAGLTGVALVQSGAWTVGALANHIWSYAGPSGREDVSATFLQPFVSYNFGKGFSVTLNSEASYDWVREQWTVPINLGAAQVFKIGDQAMSASVGIRYYAVRPDSAPRWGLRAAVTFLFPT
nr:hypothetical protein [Enterovirga rhinocerotis]